MTSCLPRHGRQSAPVILLYFTAEVGEETVASAVLERRYDAPDVMQRAVRDDGLAGTFFQPAAPGPHPGLMVVGGSTGGSFLGPLRDSVNAGAAGLRTPVDPLLPGRFASQQHVACKVEGVTI